ncbi:MAG TPA: hypothetical protein DCY94_04070 [Firmicutes bacterium]|nr:hypothetical protein [Bacillota bacterium]
MVYQISIIKKDMTRSLWEEVTKVLCRFLKTIDSFKIEVNISDNKITYYLTMNAKIEPILSELATVIFKPVDHKTTRRHTFGMVPYKSGDNLIDMRGRFKRKYGDMNGVVVDFYKFGSKVFTKVVASFGGEKSYSVLGGDAYSILAVDFKTLKTYTTPSDAKYFNVLKVLPIFKGMRENAIIKVDAFPYSDQQMYLGLSEYDFARHSLIIGSSGSGKSKFLSLLVEEASRNERLRSEYTFLVLDPHAEIESDIGGISKVIDFRNVNSSIDLFKANGEWSVSYTEFILDVFKGELASNYNSKLERILRYAVCLLSTAHAFDFQNLRKLLLDPSYRNELLNEYRGVVPSIVSTFFLVDYPELKTTSYGVAIAPIVSFLDEMEMIPAFRETGGLSLEECIESNFCTLVSLDSNILGQGGLKTIASLVSSTLFSVAAKKDLKKKVVFIVDEISVIESPVLKRFLSESRKYGVALVLAGQYLNQVSEELRLAIFANVMNYYIFRSSRVDASILVDNLNIKLEGTDKDGAISYLTGLNMREVISKITYAGKTYPPFKGTTVDVTAIPKIKEELVDREENKNKQSKSREITFETGNVDFFEITKETSTRRKEWEDE